MLLQFYILALVACTALVQIALCLTFLVYRILVEEREKKHEIARHWQPSVHDMDTARVRRVRIP